MKVLALFALSSLAPAALAQDGLTLFQPNGSTTAYMIDGAGAVVRTWPGTDVPGLGVYLQSNGDLLRAQKLAQGPPGVGGGLERLTWDAQVTWQYVHSIAGETPHHDVEVLPNGHVLMTIWEEITMQEAIDRGRHPNFVGPIFLPDKIIEVQQTGPNAGAIVWEWRAWDHLIQDFDSTLPNHGVVADHPERIDLNFPLDLPNGGDWMHVNGLDYNPLLDQIAICVPTFNELWIIDHSTTTQEAAGSTGGNSGKGGDLLYRWGNPLAYQRGTANDRQLFFSHDVTWIEPGRPGAGNILVFNNGRQRPTGNWSSVDELVPPVDAQGGYTLPAGAPYGPAGLTWTYSDPPNFFTLAMGGAERLTNGNTLITEALTGRLFEVDAAGATTWQYINPFGSPNSIFKARRHPDCRTPQSFCQTTANSAGPGATIGWSGSTSLSADDLVLGSSGAIPTQFGIFFYGAGDATFPSGEGAVCIGGGDLFRLPLVQCDGAGAATHAVDLANLPHGGAAQTFGTWNFQFWYRDPSGGTSGWNFSDALAVTFCP